MRGARSGRLWMLLILPLSLVSWVALATAPAGPAGALPATGSIEMTVGPSTAGNNPVTVSGAIHDSGHLSIVNEHGSADSAGDFARAVLGQGTLDIDFRPLKSELQTVVPSLRVSLLREGSSCSVYASISGHVILQGGTGAYQGIRPAQLGTTVSYEAVGGTGEPCRVHDSLVGLASPFTVVTMSGDIQ